MLPDGHLTGKHCHVQADILISVSILVDDWHIYLCGSLPTVAHVPADAGCQIDQHVIYAIVEPDVSVIKVYTHE